VTREFKNGERVTLTFPVYPNRQAIASIPFRSIRLSSFSDGPLSRFSPISHFCTVDTLVLSSAWMSDRAPEAPPASHRA
jgi:hypothetical protein